MSQVIGEGERVEFHHTSFWQFLSTKGGEFVVVVVVVGVV